MESSKKTKIKFLKKNRTIARLDIKGPNLIKGISFEGLRVLGSPIEFAEKYYLEGIDELIYIDTVATLYGRNNILDLVKKVGEKVFIPITVGGGIRTVEDAGNFLNAELINIKPKEGLLVLFPSYLYHSVEENLSNDERIVISFNLDSK